MIVWLHLAGGTTLACQIDEHDARDLVNTVRQRWRTPDPEAPDIALGAHDLDTWVRVADISALELRAEEPEQEERP